MLPIADGLDLDVAAHELRRGELAVHLRPKEYGLLALWHPIRVAPTRVASCWSACGGMTARAARGPWTSMSAGSGRRSKPIRSVPSTS